LTKTGFLRTILPADEGSGEGAQTSTDRTAIQDKAREMGCWSLNKCFGHSTEKTCQNKMATLKPFERAAFESGLDTFLY
jgi:hypothetical protein